VAKGRGGGFTKTPLLDRRGETEGFGVVDPVQLASAYLLISYLVQLVLLNAQNAAPGRHSFLFEFRAPPSGGQNKTAFFNFLIYR